MVYKPALKYAVIYSALFIIGFSLWFTTDEQIDKNTVFYINLAVLTMFVTTYIIQRKEEQKRRLAQQQQ